MSFHCDYAQLICLRLNLTKISSRESILSMWFVWYEPSDRSGS